MKLFLYERWTLQDAEKYPQRMYVFGDNLIRVGCGGQACLRHSKAHNTFGIATKRSPGWNDCDFFNDDEYEDNIALIQADFDALPFEDFEELALPMNCWGTGLSDMPSRCPKTFAFVESLYDSLLKKYADDSADEWE